jgi:hypothetical protein
MRPVCWSIVVKEKPTVRSAFLGAFPSDRIPKMTKDVTVYFFIQNSTFKDELTMHNAVATQNASKLYQRNPGTTCNLTIWRVGVIIFCRQKAMSIQYYECVSVFLPYLSCTKIASFHDII